MVFGLADIELLTNGRVRGFMYEVGCWEGLALKFPSNSRREAGLAKTDRGGETPYKESTDCLLMNMLLLTAALWYVHPYCDCSIAACLPSKADM